MAHRIRIHEFGGPEVMKWEEFTPPAPGPGEVLIRHTAIGLNFIDTYHRTGLYPQELPFTPGGEGAGVVEALGAGVSNLSVGERIAYPSSPPGAYSEYRLMDATRLVKLPDQISDEVAAAMMLKGCTAEYLIRRTFRVEPGQWVLWHAAAGGVGSIACQWLTSLGVKLIGTAGGAEKVARAKALGCDHVIDYRADDFATKVMEITADRGVHVVFDGVGKDTFEGSLSVLRRRGMMVSFGNASGAVPPVSPLALSKAGSVFLTRPTLFDYYATPEDFAAGSRSLLDVVTSGKVRVDINQKFSLRQAEDAHKALESRQTTGSTILLP